MKQTIRLNENELKELIKEAVKEISFRTASNAVDKMRKLGQRHRAAKLDNTYNDIHGDKYGYYELGGPEAGVDLFPGAEEKPEGISRTHFAYMPYKVGEPVRIEALDGKPNDDLRTDNRKEARSIARHINNVAGDPNYTSKNDFIAEAISRAIRKVLREGMEPEETWHVQETIGGWRQNPIFSGTYDECLDYMEEYCNNSNSSYALVPDSELDVDYLNDEE